MVQPSQPDNCFPGQIAVSMTVKPDPIDARGISNPVEKDVRIKLDSIVKRYGKYLALNNVSLTIGPGITGLLGPNGAGKSTLIKVLLGLVKVTAGDGEVLGLPLRTAGRQIRSQVGYMPEDDCYIAGMSGVEVVRFAASLSGMPQVEGLRRAHEILDFSGAEQERYRDIDTYSTGMRQKVKFAQAIVHDPPLLILDEPTSSLDPEEREAMLARIRTMATRHQKTVIISTHILPDVQSICDQVVILSQGEVRLNDSLSNLNRPTAPGITIQTVRDADGLVNALENQGFSIRVHSPTLFFMSAQSEAAIAKVWEVAREVGIGIMSMTPMKNSLEEVFMRAVQESRRADS